MFGCLRCSDNTPDRMDRSLEMCRCFVPRKSVAQHCQEQPYQFPWVIQFESRTAQVIHDMKRDVFTVEHHEHVMKASSKKIPDPNIVQLWWNLRYISVAIRVIHKPAVHLVALALGLAFYLWLLMLLYDVFLSLMPVEGNGLCNTRLGYDAAARQPVLCF